MSSPDSSDRSIWAGVSLRFCLRMMQRWSIDDAMQRPASTNGPDARAAAADVARRCGRPCGPTPIQPPPCCLVLSRAPSATAPILSSEGYSGHTARRRQPGASERANRHPRSAAGGERRAAAAGGARSARDSAVAPLFFPLAWVVCYTGGMAWDLGCVCSQSHCATGETQRFAAQLSRRPGRCRGRPRRRSTTSRWRARPTWPRRRTRGVAGGQTPRRRRRSQRPCSRSSEAT
jgi:hypothetical protein